MGEEEVNEEEEEEEEELRRVVQEEVNRLLSEKQLSYVCKCLANAGVVGIYFYLWC